MDLQRRPRPTDIAAVSAAALVFVSLAGCASETENTAERPPSTGCPGGPVNVVVSVDQWGEMVSELGGDCAIVKTVLASSSVDPHEYEPSPADAAAFRKARLVVVNGADYDHWAVDLAATSARSATVIDVAELTGTAEGANPHLWYNPQAVSAAADAVSAQLAEINPEAAGYFDERHTTFTTAMQPYEDMIAKIKSEAGGKSYAATEPVFDYQAEALGLVDRTPQGYRQAAASGSEPPPAALQAFRMALADRQVDVLIFNTQTEGSVSQQLREAAEKAGVPVVEVTETVPPGEGSFVDWQVGQLKALAKALGVSL